MSNFEKFVLLDEQAKVADALRRVFEIYINSDGAVRPHTMLTGQSGTGKTAIVKWLCNDFDCNLIEVSASQLTDEGVSGNSISKALVPLETSQDRPTVVFFDEFDKLFKKDYRAGDVISGTLGVQNELLTLLETTKTAVLGQYGHYNQVGTGHVLYIFAGSFHGEDIKELDELLDFGVKPEFLGRVNVYYNTIPLSDDSIVKYMSECALLDTYLELFENVDKDYVLQIKVPVLKRKIKKSPLGLRLAHAEINDFFINVDPETGLYTHPTPINKPIKKSIPFTKKGK